MKFILASDWHIRQERPRCRLDADWIQTQREHIRRVFDIATKHDVPVVHTGDLFHHARVATEVVNMVISEIKAFPNAFYLMAGNHDLPYHSVENLEQSSIGTLLHFVNTPQEVNERLFKQTFDWAHFGTDKAGYAECRLIHRLVWPNAEARPAGIENIGQTAEELLEEFPDNRMILCGDYHHAFTFEKDGRIVVNPGCLNIQSADMIGYVPRVYLIDTTLGTAEPIDIPDDGSLVTDTYLRADEVRDDKITAFVEAIRKGTGVSLDFKANLDQRIAETTPEVRNLLLGIIDTIFNESK